MESQLDGKSLVWVSWDPTDFFTAATYRMLSDRLADSKVKLQLIRPANWEVFGEPWQRQQIGLVTFALPNANEIPQVCKFLWRQRNRGDQTVSACFVAPELVESVPLLLESGAQIVVSQLTSWQSTLDRVLSQVPLSNQGFHPLTSGLISRLPWPDA